MSCVLLDFEVDVMTLKRVSKCRIHLEAHASLQLYPNAQGLPLLLQVLLDQSLSPCPPHHIHPSAPKNDSSLLVFLESSPALGCRLFI